MSLFADNGERLELPVAIVRDRNPDRTVKVIRVYHSMWPLTGKHRVCSPLLPADPELHAEGTPGDYQRATWKGSWAPFETDGYAPEPSGGAYLHRSAAGARRAPVRQRGWHRAGALHSHRRRHAMRHRVQLRALGGQRSRPRRVSRSTSVEAAGCFRRRASTRTWNRQPSRTRSPATREACPTRAEPG